MNQCSESSPTCPAVPLERTGWLVSLRRYLLATAGILCVGLAYLGAIIPGMPTTLFLIMAGYLFTRSCPYLEQRLIRNRFFSRFHRYLDDPAAIPMSARWTALGAMWTSVTISSAVLWITPGIQLWIPALVIVLGAIGTPVILRMGQGRARNSSECAQKPDSEHTLAD